MSTTTTMELREVAMTNSKPETPPHTSSVNHEEASTPMAKVEKRGTTAIIISTITGVTMISSLLSGLVTIALPVMARDLDIPQALLLWPLSIYSLTCGCTLILSGAVADVVGSRVMYLLGTFLQSIFTLASGLSRTSTQLIVFRALAGIAISFCLPSAVSLITTYFSTGRRRNVAFAAMGGGQPLGFTLGLVMGGSMTDKLGWQAGLYMAAGINSVLFILAFFGLPKVPHTESLSLQKLRREVDWVGAFILSTALALLLYVFSTWTGNISNIDSAESLSCLITGIALLPAFAFWVNRQEKLGKAVLIRNSLWRNKSFTSICINVALIWGSFNASETFLTFYWQDFRHLSATATSIRFLPEPVMGAVINILIGLYVHRLRANWTLAVAIIASAAAPLILALMRPNAKYWEFEFAAVALIPVATDVLYTISQLVITAEFPENTQALAGGVFNTVAQIGKSVGIALSAVVASSITAKAEAGTDTHEQSLLRGYRAAWWFTFAATVACIFVTFIGLRHLNKVGLKKD